MDQPNNSITGALTFSTTRWQFCPQDGCRLEFWWVFCPKCGGKVSGVVSSWANWVNGGTVGPSDPIAVTTTSGLPTDPLIVVDIQNEWTYANCKAFERANERARVIGKANEPVKPLFAPWPTTTDADWDLGCCGI